MRDDTTEAADEIAALQTDFWDKQKDAERAAYALASALPVGPARLKAFAVYEAIRRAPLAC